MKKLWIICLSLLIPAILYSFSYGSLYQKCAPTTVVLFNVKEHRLGTGVLIDETHILTVAHLIVKSTDTLEVMGYTEHFIAHANVIACDHAVDLAVVTLDHSLLDTTWAQIATSNAPVGTNVFIIGSGAGLLWTATQGIVSGENRLHEKYGQTDATVNPGNSGGPVFDTHGRIIGIVDAKVSDPMDGIENIGFFIPVDQIRKFLAKYTLGSNDL